MNMTGVSPLILYYVVRETDFKSALKEPLTLYKNNVVPGEIKGEKLEINFATS